MAVQVYQAYELVNLENREILNIQAPGLPVVTLADHEVAMAEKDREIARLSEKVKTLTAWYDTMFGTPCEEIRHAQQLEEQEEKYNVLLDQAIRFAQWIVLVQKPYEDAVVHDPMYTEALAFLDQLEVKAHLTNHH